jgi:hypothetical protein
MGFHEPDLLQRGQDNHSDKGTGRKQLTMGKIDQLDDAVNHGIAQCDQGINAAQKYGIDYLLKYKRFQLHMIRNPSLWFGGQMSEDRRQMPEDRFWKSEV